MKLVTCIIKPFKLDDVREALSEVGVQGMTVIEVKGFADKKGHTELYRGAEYVVDFLPKVKIETAVDDGLLDQVIEAVSKAANTGKVGDGKIFVTTLDEVVRIRRERRAQKPSNIKRIIIMEAVTQLSYSVDTLYFLVCGALVMFMAPGFAMLESGLCEPKYPRRF